MPTYVILLYSGITVEKSYDDLIKASRNDVSTYLSANNAPSLEGIPHFLRHNPKVTMDHKGAFHKCYIKYSPKFFFQFVVIRNAHSRKIDFTGPLPDLKNNWMALIGEDLFSPSH